MANPKVRLCSPADASLVHRLTQAAFEEYVGLLEPPSGALRETVQSVQHDLEANGGAIAWMGGEPVGCLRFDVRPDHLHVRRVAVPPERRRAGVGTALMRWAHAYGRELGVPEVRLGVRAQLAGNRAFYEALGYEVMARHRRPESDNAFWDELRLSL